MPKPNYAFEKRQRELETKRKKADKAARKSQPATQPAGDSDDTSTQASLAPAAAADGTPL